MSNDKTAAVINVGEVLARELVFTQGNNDHLYILQAPGAQDDYLATMHRFPKHQIKRTTDFHIEDSWDDSKWFACYKVDCFDPPFAVIRAKTLESALEAFEDEFEKWLAVAPESADDYPEDDRTYNSNGTHIDTDNVQIHELTLIRIELARPEGVTL